MDYLHILHTILKIAIYITYFAGIIYVVVTAILQNGNPVKTISWILVLVLLPVIGFIFFMFLGQNLRKEKIIARKGLKNHDSITSIAHEQVNNLSEIKNINSLYEDNIQLITLLLNNSNAVVTVGNKVDILHDGNMTFESVISAIENAQSFIHLEYYIFADDNIGRRIIDILKRKAQSGIEVRMIVDDVGSWELKTPFYKEMWNSNIYIYSFLRVHFPKLTSKINYRNHRKIIIVDGKVGFVGGLNIADRYISGNKKLGIWRDTHLRIEGDAVNSLQTVFSIDWYFVSKEELNDKKYFPHQKPIHDKTVQIVSSGADSDWPSIMMGIIHAITSAKQSVYIETPYLIPTEGVLLALKTAALAGIDIKIIMPQKSDSMITLFSTRSYIRELLEAGVKIYFYQKGFLHSKILIIDNFVSIVGSANMDFRSFEQNFEISAFIYNTDIAQELTEKFFEDISNSNFITLTDWHSRSRMEKVKESFARLISPMM